MSDDRIIIGLSGLAGSGKSFAANHLIKNHGFTLVKFASPLKNMLRAIGMTESEIEGEDKERPAEWLCGKSPRHAMQTLGTEWGRDCIGENFWVDLWKRRVQEFDRVVCDDVRFANEAAALRDMGGFVLRIDRQSLFEIGGDHPSEALAFDPDFTIANSGGDDFAEMLDQLTSDAISRHHERACGAVEGFPV